MTVLEKPDSVIVVAVDGSEIVVVRQSRAGASAVTVELPAGSIEDGESPEETAARELLEECGLAAAAWRPLGSFWAAPDYATEYVHAFEATELVQAGAAAPAVAMTTLVSRTAATGAASARARAARTSA